MGSGLIQGHIFFSSISFFWIYSIQINKNDVSQSSIDILGGQTTASPTGTNKTWNMNAGDYLTVDILTIGTTNKGEDLVIQFKYKQT